MGRNTARTNGFGQLDICENVGCTDSNIIVIVLAAIIIIAVVAIIVAVVAAIAVITIVTVVGAALPPLSTCTF